MFLAIPIILVELVGSAWLGDALEETIAVGWGIATVLLLIAYTRPGLRWNFTWWMRANVLFAYLLYNIGVYRLIATRSNQFTTSPESAWLIAFIGGGVALLSVSLLYIGQRSSELIDPDDELVYVAREAPPPAGPATGYCGHCGMLVHVEAGQCLICGSAAQAV